MKKFAVFILYSSLKSFRELVPLFSALFRNVEQSLPYIEILQEIGSCREFTSAFSVAFLFIPV